MCLLHVVFQHAARHCTQDKNAPTRLAPVIEIEATAVAMHLPVLLRGLSANIRFLLFAGACIILVVFVCSWRD